MYSSLEIFTDYKVDMLLGVVIGLLLAVVIVFIVVLKAAFDFWKQS